MDSKWVSLCAAVFAMLCAGTNFAFGAFGQKIKDHLQISQGSLQLISVLGNLGMWTNAVGGHLSDRFGARVVMLAGAVLIGLGYLGMYLVLWSGEGKSWQVAVAAVSWFLVGHGSGWVFISNLFANAKRFDAYQRGLAVALMGCCFSCSPMFWVAILNGCLGGTFKNQQCTSGVFAGKIQDYFAFLAVVIPVIVAIAASLTKPPPAAYSSIGNTAQATRRLHLVLSGILCFAVCILVVTAYSTQVDTSITKWTNWLLIALLAMFLAVPCGTAAAGDDGAAAVDTIRAPPTAQPETNIPSSRAVKTLRFWLIWLTFGSTVGGAVLILNLFSQLAKSRGDATPQKTASLCVTLFAGCDIFSRAVAGLVGNRITPTHMFMVPPVLLSLASVVLLADEGKTGLIVASTLAGPANGLNWIVGPVLVARVFGISVAGANFGIIVFGAATFALLLSLGVVSLVISQYSTDASRCDVSCFQVTFVVTAALGTAAACLSFVLHHQLKLKRDTSTHRRELEIQAIQRLD
mmetsp:Transcript_18387/g.35990  ORF Transcript_18387/g.35990 Transcript_18387/m.35990 type:complete len:519 (-) Transcript_18387:11-1567(-)|eukprot:CAMPEP_0175124186 /NCGR_PEP_ID=MMETSP0087-20121206/2646_1 /TAXON_ID=136419 /ORGANISM="Unknown Unknown, Strain D1" /LENGTH=518 /DNA_ID=CAMNT_0016405935 /DNA_START=28 /DNA_END=1584 /DNA_ORIENTATION=+